ncbi:colicin-like bacteriocin tRNase domain-containing protein [Klebsiella pneumoniae]|uniref:colicin-like bacteriocin tRNase domain-containing protein n=1 Tax=Klebsiella pneumoniae TaxID=573 RepID=UPI003B285568
MVAEKGDSSAGFTAGGVNPRPLFVSERPDRNRLSVTDVLTPAQVKQRQEEEKRRQQAWDRSSRKRAERL